MNVWCAIPGYRTRLRPCITGDCSVPCSRATGGPGTQRELADRTGASALLRRGLVVEWDVRVDGTPVPQAAGSFLRQRVSEGQPLRVDVEARNLGSQDSLYGSDEEFRVRPVLQPVHAGVVTAEPSSLTLRLQLLEPPQASLQLTVVDDGVPEPRQEIELTLSGTPSYGASPPPAHLLLEVPRHGYQVQDLKLSSAAVQTDEEFYVEVELNAVVPAPVLLIAALQCHGRAAEPGVARGGGGQHGASVRIPAGCRELPLDGTGCAFPGVGAGRPGVAARAHGRGGASWTWGCAGCS